MSEVINISDVGFEKFLMNAGMCQTNSVRVSDAMSELHSALCHMDLQQLKQFKQTDFGIHAASLCRVYGATESGLRENF